MPVVVAGLVLGLLLMLLSRTGDLHTSDADAAGENAEMLAYTEILEHKIAQMTEGLVGAGEIHVLVTAECSAETVYAEESTKNGETVSERYLLASGSQPVPVRIVTPQIKGIAVICPRGGDARVQMELISMLSAAFGIPAQHIYIGGPQNSLSH